MKTQFLLILAIFIEEALFFTGMLRFLYSLALELTPGGANSHQTHSNVAWD